MKKITLIICLLACISFAQTSIFAGLGQAYHGLVGVEQTFLKGHLSANAHWLGYDSDYDFMGGAGVATTPTSTWTMADSAMTKLPSPSPSAWS